MSTLINGDTLHDSIVIDKQSGTVVTLGTSQKYIEKNIQLTLNVQSGSVGVSDVNITANPMIIVNDEGLITATVSGLESVSPTIVSGYVSSGTAGSINVSGSTTLQLPIATINDTKAYLGIEN